MIVDDGKVTYAGPQSGVSSFETDAVINVQGKWVTPGIFMPVTDLGLYDVSGVGETNDTSARGSRFNAALDASTAVNYASQHVAVSRRAGITRASIVTTPSGAIFGGQGAIIDTGEDANPIVKARAFQIVTLGERGGEINEIYRAAAARILFDGEEIATVLEEEGANLETLMQETGAPCWPPDPPSEGACPVE